MYIHTYTYRDVYKYFGMYINICVTFKRRQGRAEPCLRHHRAAAGGGPRRRERVGASSY